MAIKDVFKISRKTFFNPSGWIGTTELKATTKTMWGIVKGLLTPAKPERIESFEEALKRLNLTEKEVKQRAKTYFEYAIFFLILATGSLASGFYYLFHHKTLIGGLFGIAVTALFMTQAFRFHFWYFQIKHRKLGCTFDEWRRGRVSRHEEPKSK